MSRFILWYLEETLLAYLQKWDFMLPTPSVGEPWKQGVSCVLWTAQKNKSQKNRRQTLWTKSQPHWSPWQKIPLTSIAFYSVAACPCVQPQAPFNVTVSISCMTTTRGRIQPSPFLLWHRTCTLSNRQHFFKTGLVCLVIQEEYCIIKKVFLSKCRMTGIESFTSYSVTFLSILLHLGHTYFSFTEYSHIQLHWLLFRCMAKDTDEGVWWTVCIITSLIFIHSKITQYFYEKKIIFWTLPRETIVFLQPHASRTLTKFHMWSFFMGSEASY